MARERIDQEGWHNVTVEQSPAEDAQIAPIADAALFCAVHDILQSPDALRNVLSKLRPGARVAAGGGKWAKPWMVAVNLPVTMLHAPDVGASRVWAAAASSRATARGRARPGASARQRVHPDRPGDVTDPASSPGGQRCTRRVQGACRRRVRLVHAVRCHGVALASSARGRTTVAR